MLRAMTELTFVNDFFDIIDGARELKLKPSKPGERFSQVFDFKIEEDGDYLTRWSDPGARMVYTHSSINDLRKAYSI